ncbi:hypothetical protein J6590_005844 [Homalodisca vitripennis]|nr:hypothetical protein J6590_005844 [Homalodisca vitripennis]
MRRAAGREPQAVDRSLQLSIAISDSRPTSEDCAQIHVGYIRRQNVLGPPGARRSERTLQMKHGSSEQGSSLDAAGGCNIIVEIGFCQSSQKVVNMPRDAADPIKN